MVLTVAVVGAGAAGLAAARRLKENSEKFRYTVFEQGSHIGGTWIYDERVGNNEYGLPIHSSMYKSLRTNLPKEVMGYPDYPIRKPSDKSYIDAADILNFLQEFVQHFDLLPNIKFNHFVQKIDPTGKNKIWQITTKDLVRDEIQTEEFDAVMVCNGHYHVPNIPRFDGDDIFEGKLMHSHDYRVPQSFSGQCVVVVGAGPSGLDIALDISKVAKKVILSHHLPDKINTSFPANFSFKPDIKRISKTSVTFMDSSTEDNIDFIFLCTGYKYNLPFLTKACGVQITDNYVHPLYKHLVSIENPTLCLIGLPFYVCAFSMFDLQARFFLKSLDGTFQLPSKEDMLINENTEMAVRRYKGFTFRQSHQMGPLQGSYYQTLAETAGIDGLPPVLTKLHNESSRRFLEDLINYRNDKYIIINNEDFEEVL